MADSVLVNLEDPLTENVYSFYISNEDEERLKTDEEFANALLRHAKKNYRRLTDNDSESFNGNEGISIAEGEVEAEPNASERKIWSHEETMLIIDCVEAHYDELNHPKKRKHIWENVANDLSSHGINVSSAGCAQKWKNLLRSYKCSKENTNKTGRGPSRFLYFDKMNDFLGNKPNISSPHTVDIALLRDSPSTSSETLQASELEVSGVTGQGDDDSNECDKIGKKGRLTKKSDYFRSKTELNLFKIKHIEDRNLQKEAYLKQKLSLEERKVLALEELVNLRKRKYDAQ